MNRKIVYAIVMISLFCMLPAFSGSQAVPPETFSKNDLVTNEIYNYDGNTVEIIEQTDDTTQLLLNDTYQLDLTHNQTNLGVKCTDIDDGLSPKADPVLFDVDFSTTETERNLHITTPDFELFFENVGENGDLWSGAILGMPEPLTFTFNSTSKELTIIDSITTITYDGMNLFIIGDYGSITILRENDTAFLIDTSEVGMFLLNWNEAGDYFGINYYLVTEITGSIPGGLLPIYTDPIISINVDFNGISVSWAGVNVYLHSMMLIIVYDYISITWYFGFLIERIIFLIWDITIIFYLAIFELIIVIIYESIEIKIYETQIVIVYEYIEIVIVFISLFIWQFTFIFHFEFWYIQIIFLIDIIVNLIFLPVRIIFVPIILPVFIPLIYYIPVLISVNINIYLPYASPQMFIDVASEDLAFPEHTMEYKVTDASGSPIDDATVSVNYNGTDYPATFVSNGIYTVDLPASLEEESITVTAEKDWYPTAQLTYTLNVDWLASEVNVTETVTEGSVLPYTFIAISMITVFLGAMIVNKKRRD
ncbi:MAG: carboxypeptidase-like regulatory domain-containing protein [Candidatus Thorarchaeota archaeon]